MNRLSQLARSVSGPMRNYLNDHFENVKAEVRYSREVADRDRPTEGFLQGVSAHLTALSQQVRDLSNQAGDGAAFHGRQLLRIEQQLERLTERVEQIESHLDNPGAPR